MKIPDGWKLQRLDQIASKKKYSIAGGPFGSNLKRSDYTDDGIRIILLQNIGNGRFIDNYFEYTSEKKADELLASNIYSGEIILSKMGDPVARAAIVPNSNERYVMCSDGIRFVPDKTQDNLFIFYAINDWSFRKQAISKSTGSTRQRISLGDLKSCKILTPPLEEQKNIAQILSTWDEAIEAVEELVEKKKKMKRGLLRKYLPTNERFYVGKGWNNLKLRKVVDILDSKRVPLNSEQRSNMSGDVPYYGANGVVDYVNDHIFDEKLILLAEDGGHFEEYRTRPIAYIVEGKSWVNNHAHVLVVKEEFDFNFCFYSLQHRNITKYLNGGTRAKLNRGELEKIPLFVPDLETQKQIGQMFKQIDDQIQLLNSKKKLLESQKKGLMQRLLTGKARVN